MCVISVVVVGFCCIYFADNNATKKTTFIYFQWFPMKHRVWVRERELIKVYYL